MDHFHHLSRQMTVVSNPRHQEALGGFHLHFVGAGRRRFTHHGWWPTQVDFFVIDATSFGQRVRIPACGREFYRDSTTVSLYAPGTRYEEFCNGSLEFDDAWAVFRAGRRTNPLQSLVRDNGHCVFRDTDGLMRRQLREATAIADHDPGMRWAAAAAFLRALALLYRAVPVAGAGLRHIRPLEEQRQRRMPFRDRVLRILREDPARNVTVDELARRLGLSRSSLTHRFSLEMGETLVELKNRLRIARAQALLGVTDKSIKEIAFKLGFHDPAYFSRVFHKTAGVSPRQYRQLMAEAGGPDPQDEPVDT